jgi:hypothetical protein
VDNTPELVTEPLAQLESVGDLIGQAIRLYRANFIAILRALILPTIVFTAGRIVLQFAVAQHPSFDLKNPANYLGLLGICMIIAPLWMLTLRQVALTTHLVGYASSFVDAYRKIGTKQWQLFGCLWLSSLAFFVNAVAWLIFAIVLALLYRSFSQSSDNVIAPVAIVLITIAGVMIGSFLVTAFWGFSCFTFSVEDKDFAKALQTAVSYIAGNAVRVIMFVLAVGVCMSALMPPLYLPPVLVGALEGYRYAVAHGRSMTQIPPYLLVFGQVWESMINMFLWPLFFFCLGLFYRDLTVRERATDVVKRLEQLELSGI